MKYEHSHTGIPLCPGCALELGHDGPCVTARHDVLHRIGGPWHNNKPCDRAPVGWRCTRVMGHGGPCAAEPGDPGRGRQLSEAELDDPEYMRGYVAEINATATQAVHAAFRRGQVEAQRKAGPTGPAMPPRLPVDVLEKVVLENDMDNSTGHIRVASLYRSIRRWLGLAQEQKKGTES